jgi:4-amino-4-deoxy-L-arabinose transferase-like glycosyltransferase
MQLNRLLQHPLRIPLLLTAAGALLFLPFLGSVPLFDWDEINFAEAAREMIVTGDYLNVQINYLPFWEKPPFFFWLQVLSMKIFGINEFASRFPNALCGIITLLTLYGMGKRLYNTQMGLIWALVYAGSVLPFVYFKSGIIDPWFNLFIFTAIYFAVLYLTSTEKRTSYALTSGLLIGLAILTKGPVGLLLFGLSGLIYLILTRFRMRLRPSHAAAFLGGVLITGGSWFLIQFLTGNGEVIDDFIRYQVRLFRTEDAGHGGFFLYHFLVVFAGVFPASVFAMSGFRSQAEESSVQHAWRLCCIILLAVVLLVFTIVRTKIVHYSSLAYFPLTWLASLYIYHIEARNGRFNRVTVITTGIMAVMWITAVIGLVVLMRNIHWLTDSGLVKDAFAVANLQAQVKWSGLEALIVTVPALGLSLFFFAKRISARIASLFTATMLFTFLVMAVFTPRVEGYTQQAAIEFYREKSTEDCYIQTLGFKSYAHLFYGQKKPPANPHSYDQDWLLKGDIDKPAYFVFKITRKDEYAMEYPQLNILYEKNGFVFARREKVK